MKSRSRVIVVFLAVAVAGLLAGSAFAYFTVTGSGSGSVITGTSQTVTVEAVTSGSPSSTLLPGGTGDLLVQLENSASTAVTIVAISQNGPATPVGGNGCTASNDSVTVPSQTGLSISVATGSQLVHFAGAAAMASSSASGCQGAAFDIPVTLTVQQP